MNPGLLLTRFDRVSDAPDAIPRLRRFILDLAVRGKLLEARPADEPASQLLDRIRAEKEQLVKNGEIPKPKLLPPIDRVPFAIPPNWCWVRLNDITSYIQRGKSPKYATDDGFPVVSQKCVQWRGLELRFAKKITRESIATYEDIRFLRDGDLLWNSTGTGTIGRIVKVTSPPSQLVCDSHVTVVRCLEVDAEYIRSWLRSDDVYGCIEDLAAGSTNQVELTSQMAINQVVPLPPDAEQRRIVAKLDELMALCDRLEAAKDEQESRRDRLATASLHHLNNGANAEAFRKHTDFYLEHLSRLTTRSEQVEELRQTILNLAVRGQLVSEDTDDEPVVELLARNDQERRMIAKEDRRADVGRQGLLAAESRWSIPPSWDWCALADLVLFIDYRGKTPIKTAQGVRLITAKNVKRGFINIFPEEFLSEPSYRTWMTRGFPKEGDVLFTTEAPMGNAAVVRLPERFALAQRVICFRSYGSVNPDFLILQLLSEPFQSILNKTSTGLTAKGIKAAKLKRLPIAIPPLAEQLRIVAKVNQLITLCDELKAQLTTAQTEQRRLLEAVLHQSLYVTT